MWIRFERHGANATAAAGDHGPLPPSGHNDSVSYFFSGSSFFFSLPSMYWLQGCARIGPLVFQTTLNCPSFWTSPMKTGFHRWWFFSSILTSKPSGALNFCPPIAAITLSGSVDLALVTACAHMCIPTYVASIGSLVSGLSAPGSFFALAYAAHFFLNASFSGFLTDMK